ncbi:MAG: FHA domain-containing protein [Candidatus Eisenbacteria bacterium]
MSQSIIAVRVSLKGRPVKEFRFSETRISIGRDPGSNVFLDNPGISREHAVLERKGNGLYVQDMGSANGTFLNDEQIRRERVREGDKIRIGKFLLELEIIDDRRGTTDAGRSPAAAFEGTMVLETAQIDRLMHQAKAAETEAAAMVDVEPSVDGNTVRVPAHAAGPRVHALPQAAPVAPPSGLEWWKSQVWGLAIGFACGVVFGALIVRFLAR